jgi:hypothetical protein
MPKAVYVKSRLCQKLFMSKAVYVKACLRLNPASTIIRI